MINFSSLPVALLYVATASAQPRLEADLLGNGRTQEITLEMFPRDDFGDFRLAVGKASFSGEYFSWDGDTPKIHLVKLDKKDTAKQVMLEVVGPVDCSFHFLSYDGTSLNLLGTLESGHCEHEPEVLGNGEVIMPYWEGFWASRRVFKLSGQPKRLLPVEQRFYSLNVTGVVTSRLDLYSKGSDKPITHLDVGTRFSLQRFDTSTERYEVWVDGRVKGWATIDHEHVAELPWAG